MSVVRGVGRGWGCGGVAGSLTWGVCDVVKSVSCEGVCERGSVRCEGVLVGRGEGVGSYSHLLLSFVLQLTDELGEPLSLSAPLICGL